MGDGDKTPLRLQFNPKVRLEFHGATITSDAGLLPIRELDDALATAWSSAGTPSSTSLLCSTSSHGRTDMVTDSLYTELFNCCR